MSKYTRVFLPKNKCYTSAGRGTARYHFTGFNPEECDDRENCTDCQEMTFLFKELCDVDPKYRQEWTKLQARSARIPQRTAQRVEYRRKRGNRF